MKFLFMIFLIAAIQCDELIQCKKEIPESYGLNSYLRPRENNLYLCPTLQSSCCSPYDQFKMYHNWNKQIKVKIENFFSQVSHNLRQLKEYLEESMELNFLKIIKKLNATQEHKNALFETFLGLQNEELPKMIEQILSIQDDTYDFLMKVRQGFQCSICDFQNHGFIDIENEKVILSAQSCTYIAQNTINYSFMMNNKLYHFLMILSDLLTNFATGEIESSIKIKNYQQISKITKNCATLFKGGNKPTNVRKCFDYCRGYNFNAFSPLIEGDLTFIQKMNVQIGQFLDNYGSEKEESNKLRILEEEQNPENFELKFDKDQLENSQDIYQEKATNPNLDDYIINEMFKKHKQYQEDKLDGYKSFIKNKLMHIDSEYDYENADDNDVFQTTNHTLVAIEGYKTDIEASGIQLKAVSKKNFMEGSLVDLISHIKDNSAYQITYEKLDDPMVHQLNQMNNDYLQEFHRDNFMDFQDYGLQMKNEEVHSQLEKYKAIGVKNGYNLHRIQQLIIMIRNQKNISWVFLSSESQNSNVIQRPIEKMVKKERKLYSKYLDISDQPSVIQMDERRIRKTFERKFKFYIDLQYSKIQHKNARFVLSQLGRCFAKDCEGTILYYSGLTYSNGDFQIFFDTSTSSKKISLDDILKTWKRNKHKNQKHLLLIIDANHSGHWARKLMLKFQQNVSIQTSCTYWQQSVVEEKLGSFFTHNLLKIINKKKHELIIEPYLNSQTPRFYGQFQKVKKIFGLELKFESWQDFRKALGVSKYGSWPRVGDSDIITFQDGTRYEGDIVDNKREGMGAIFTPKGIKLYEGQWKNDKMQGLGILFYTNGYKAYEGEFHEGKKHGQGTEFNRDGIMACQGTYKNNVKHGPIVEFFENGKVKFKGIYQNNFRNGKGDEFYENGQLRVKGNWVGDLMQGEGEIYFQNGNLNFKGFFKDGLLYGQCEERWDNGQMKYIGNWNKGIYNGEGKLYNRQGQLICEGFFVDGLLHGLGKTYYINGNVLYEGEFEKGKAVGIGFLNKEEGELDYKGKDEQVFKEAMLSGVYDKRRQFKTFESSRHFDTPIELKTYDTQKIQQNNLNLKQGQGKIQVSQSYRKRRISEINGTLISGFTSTQQQIDQQKNLKGVYMKKKKIQDGRSLILDRSTQFGIKNSKNEHVLNNIRSKSFNLSKNSPKNSLKKQLKKLQKDKNLLDDILKKEIFTKKTNLKNQQGNFLSLKQQKQQNNNLNNDQQDQQPPFQIPTFYSNVKEEQAAQQQFQEEKKQQSKRQLFDPLSLITNKASQQNFQSIKELLS